jgi:hypothetical protein
MCHRAVRSAVVRDKAFRQRCARICSLHSHSRFVCRSPFLRPSHCTSHSPRPLQSPRITNRRSAPPFFRIRLHSTLGLTKAMLTSFAQLAGRFAGSVKRRTHSEFSSSLPLRSLVGPMLASVVAGRVGRYQRIVHAGSSKRPQPNHRANWTRTRTGWDACGFLARDLAEHAARRCGSAHPIRPVIRRR